MVFTESIINRLSGSISEWNVPPFVEVSAVEMTISP